MASQAYCTTPVHARSRAHEVCSPRGGGSLNRRSIYEALAPAYNKILLNSRASSPPTSPSKVQVKSKKATMATSTNRKLLYQLPQKQIHRAERRQNYDKSKSNVLVTTRGAAVSATAAAPTPPVQRIATHAPSDVASLPLLRPFHIKNVVDSPVVNTIINEQHAADTLVAMMKHEESLRAELQKARNEPSAADDDKKSGAKSKSSKKSSRKSNSGANSDRAKDLELQIETVTVTLHQCRQNLVQFAGWTKVKCARTLDSWSFELHLPEHTVPTQLVF